MMESEAFVRKIRQRWPLGTQDANVLRWIGALPPLLLLVVGLLLIAWPTLAAGPTNENGPLAGVDLAVSKQLSSDGLVVGPNKDYFVEYTITISNVGESAVSGVVISDTIPTQAVYEGSDWDCTGNECRYELGDLPASTDETATLPLRLDKDLLACPFSLANTVEVADDGSQGADQNPDDNEFTLNIDFECLPDLVVVVNDNIGSEADEDVASVLELLSLAPTAPDPRLCVEVGDLISYTIAYVNSGLETATDVVLTETVPEHTTYVGAGWNCDGGNTCTRALGTLDPGEGGVAHFIVRVDAAPPDWRVENEVGIDAAEEDLYPPDDASGDDTPICEVCLQVRKDDNAPCAFPGDEIRYTIAFTEVCGIETPGVTLTEYLPDHTSYLDSPGWQALSGDRYRYEYGTLPPHGSGQVEFSVVVDDPLPDTVVEAVNEVCVSSDGGDSSGSCFSLVTPLPLVADLRVVKHDHIGPPPPPVALQQLNRYYQTLYDRPFQESASKAAPEPVKPGQVYSYTVTYLNMGRTPATGVVLTETVPAHTSYVGYGWTHVGGDTYVYDVGDLGVQEGGQKNFWVKVNENECSNEDYIFNWAYIGGNEAECNLANNWSVEETPAELPPCEYGFYLPLICRQYTPSEPPKPQPEPVRGFVSDVAVNSETNRVYVASPQQNAVLAVDPIGDGSIIATIPVGRDPKGVAVETTHNKIYAANFESWTVTAIQGSDHTPINDLYVGAQAAKVVADSGDARVYVTNHLESENGAAAINSQSDSFEYYYSRLHATQGRYGIDMDPNAEKLFIAARDAGLIAIQDAYYPEQEPEVVKLEPVRVPYVVAFNPVTNHLFVTAADDNVVVVLAPYSIQWAQGKWVMWRGREVFLLDRANAGWIKEVPVGSGAEEGIAVNPLTGYLYVTNAGDDTVSVLKDSPDPTQIIHIQDIAVGDRPQGIDVDVERNLIYVGNTDSRDLSVIDGVQHEVIKTIPLD